MRGSPYLFAFVASACSFDAGRLAGLDAPVAPGADAHAAADGAGPGDAAGPPDATPLPPFGSPVLEIASADDPSLTADQLTIFFGAYAELALDEDIFTASREATEDAFGDRDLVGELATYSHETTAKVSADGRTIVFTRIDPTADLYIATRGSPTGAWGAEAPLDEVNTGASEYSPFLLADGLTLLFCSDATGNEEIYAVTRPDPQSDFVGPPVLLTGIGSGDDECDPMMPTPDVLYFSRSYSASDSDVFRARRVSAAGWAFTGVTRLDELVTGSNDRDPWVSADERTIWFASDRDGGIDIYRATR